MGNFNYVIKGCGCITPAGKQLQPGVNKPRNDCCNNKKFNKLQAGPEVEWANQHNTWHHFFVNVVAQKIIYAIICYCGYTLSKGNINFKNNLSIGDGVPL